MLRFVFKNRHNSYIFTNIRFRSPNYQISILTWNSLYQATMLHLPPIFQLNLQHQTLKFICQDLITIDTPTRPSLWSHRRTIVTSAEIKKRYKHSRPPSLNICLANKLETKTWGEWLVEETISSQSRPRIILAAIFHPDCRPIALPIRDLTLFNDVDSCGFFFIQIATYRIDWISRDEKKDGINLGDVKFFENKILNEILRKLYWMKK